MSKFKKEKNKYTFLKLTSQKDKIISLVCAIAIVSSLSAIIVKAATDLGALDSSSYSSLTDPSLEISNILLDDPASGTGSFSYNYTEELLASGSNQTCCGTAAKTYSCGDESFGDDTFCEYPGYKIRPDIVNFPEFDSVTHWRCLCNPRMDLALAPGGEEYKPVYSFCFARKNPAPKCSLANSFKTHFLTKEQYFSVITEDYSRHNGEKLINTEPYRSMLCEYGGNVVLNGSSESGGLFPGDPVWGCNRLNYYCKCDDTDVNSSDVLYGATCQVQFCWRDSFDRLVRNQYCGNYVLDIEIGEECERGYLNSSDGLFGHSCGDKGLCGQVKCNDCELDYSDCHSCGDVDWAEDNSSPDVLPHENLEYIKP